MKNAFFPLKIDANPSNNRIKKILHEPNSPPLPGKHRKNDGGRRIVGLGSGMDIAGRAQAPQEEPSKLYVPETTAGA